MHAHPVTRSASRAHHVGEFERRGEILAARGTPPFVVRWDDTDHDVLLFPGNDAVIDDLSSHTGADR